MNREELKVILWKEAQVNRKDCSDSILENLARILQTSREKKNLWRLIYWTINEDKYFYPQNMLGDEGEQVSVGHDFNYMDYIVYWLKKLYYQVLRSGRNV